MTLSLVAREKPALIDPDGLLTADEVATLLKVSRARAYELMRAKHFDVVRIGRQVRVRESSLREFVRTGGSPLSAT